MSQEDDIRSHDAGPGGGAGASVPPGPAAPPASRRPRGLTAWLRHGRELPRGLGYVALTGVLVGVVGGAALTFVLLVSGGGDSLTALVVAVVVLFAALWLARWFGQLELLRLHWATRRRARPVDWRPRDAFGTGRFAHAVSIFADPHYWLYLLFAVVVFPALGVVTSTTVALAALGALGGLGWGVLRAVHASGGLLALDPAALPAVPQSLAALALGLGLAVAFPSLVRLVVVVHERVGHALLGGFRSEQLAVQVAGLQVSRSAAVSAEGTALRRLERDIHDGPQQRLVRLQMDLAAATRALDVDVEKSRVLIAEALQQSREALEELRALSRGFAPPLLVDRGLAAALDSLADRSTVPTTFRSELPAGVVVPAELERNAYFVAAELVTNVAKHARAHSAELVLTSRRSPDGLGTLLELVVADDGRGGAGLRDGHGLVGVQERLLGLGGFLDVSSPTGGPTVVTVSIPLAPPVPAADPVAPPAGAPRRP